MRTRVLGVALRSPVLARPSLDCYSVMGTMHYSLLEPNSKGLRHQAPGGPRQEFPGVSFFNPPALPKLHQLLQPNRT